MCKALHACSSHDINPLNAQLNPTCPLLALLGAHHILNVSRIRVNARPEPEYLNTNNNNNNNNKY